MWLFFTLNLAAADTPQKGAAPIGGTVKAPPNVEIIPAVLEGSVQMVFAGREGDEVHIDGWPAGNLPVLTQLAEGPHQVKVVGPKGKLELEVWVTVTADKVLQIDLAAPPPPPSGVEMPVNATLPPPAPAPAPKNPS